MTGETGLIAAVFGQRKRPHGVAPNEGEFVCAECDAIVIAQRKPRDCPSCSSRRIET